MRQSYPTPRLRDYRDLVIESLSDSEAALRAALVHARAEAATYRDLALQAIHELHEATVELHTVTVERDQLRAAVAGLEHAFEVAS